MLKTVKLASAMELAQQGVDCVSGHCGLSSNPIFLSFLQLNNTTNQINIVNIVCLIINQLSHVFRCVSTDHTAYECKYKNIHLCVL